MNRQVLLTLALILGATVTVLAQQATPSHTPSTGNATAAQQTPPQQQKAEEEDVVKITTNLVQVDAVVTDKSGKIVTDLKPEEVQIFEDNKQQKITHFTYILTETAEAARTAKPSTVDKNAPPVPPTRLKPEDIRRTIAIVVDDLGLSFESTYFVRRALKKFVDEQMQPGDLVAIVRSGGGMGALQQFTSDKRQLYAAIERVKWNGLGRSGVSAFAPIEDTSSQTDEQQAANTDFNQFREDLFAVGTLGAISYVVSGLHDLPGRKSILLISDGFRIFSRDDPTRNFRTEQRLRQLVDLANRSSVVIYTMNATGLQTLGLTAADSTGQMSSQQVEQQLSNRRMAAFETQEGLDRLAKETGGIAIRNTNDLSRGIRRVLEDQKGYYLIGYRPDSSTFDAKTGRRTFHKLSLKVTRQGKFNVRMRNGFFGVTDVERTAPRTLGQQMVKALTSPFGATGVHLQLTSLFFNGDKAGSFMRSILHVDGRDLTFTDAPGERHKCVFDVLAITFGDNGVLLDQSGRTYTLQLPDELYKRVVRDGLVYYVTVPIKKAGAYQLRMSLRDTSTEHIGSASQFIEVPDLKKNRLAISGIVLRGASIGGKTTSPSSPGSGQASGNQPTTNAGENNEDVEQGNPEASPAVRHFRHGMLMEYAFVIYNARSDKTTNRPELITQVRLFRDGKPVFTGKELPFNVTNQTDFKRLIATGGIQLGTDMAPGEYVLQLVVKDMLADEKHRTATQWMDFEIVK